MIKYALVCDKGHEFESWFADSAAFDRQRKRKLVACPECESVKVDKTIMAPRLATKKGKRPVPEPAAATPKEAPVATEVTTAPPAPVAMISPQEVEFRAKLKELRDHLVKNAENVGGKFPEEARKMHYGETEHRSI